MIQFQLELYSDMKDNNSMYLQGILTVICPNCAASNFLFESDEDHGCHRCSSSLFIPHNLIKTGIKSRIRYHEMHWPNNDIVMKKRYDNYLKNKGS